MNFACMHSSKYLTYLFNHYLFKIRIHIFRQLVAKN